LVGAGGILSWTTFLREEEDSRSQRKTIEQLKNTPEKNKAEMEFPGREVGPKEKDKGEIEFPRREVAPS